MSIDSTDSQEYADIDFSLCGCDNSSNDSGPSDDESSCSSDDVVKKINDLNQPQRITFKLHVTEHTSSIWETVS